MIRIEEDFGVRGIDPAWLTEHSRRDLETAGDLNKMADVPVTMIFEDDEFLLAYAVQKPSAFLQPAEIFLLVGRAYGPKHVRRTRIILRFLADANCGFRTLIEDDFAAGKRFAEFLGFTPRGIPFDFADRRFQMYEVY